MPSTCRSLILPDKTVHILTVDYSNCHQGAFVLMFSGVKPPVLHPTIKNNDITITNHNCVFTYTIPVLYTEYTNNIYQSQVISASVHRMNDDTFLCNPVASKFELLGNYYFHFNQYKKILTIILENSILWKTICNEVN